jgi:hypothetical protein
MTPNPNAGANITENASANCATGIISAPNPRNAPTVAINAIGRRPISAIVPSDATATAS